MMEDWNDTAWTDEERLEHLKLRLCRKFGLTEDNIECRWQPDYNSYILSFRVGRDVYNSAETDIELFISQIKGALLKDQIREEK